MKRDEIKKAYEQLNSNEFNSKDSNLEPIKIYANRLDAETFCDSVLNGEFPALKLSADEMQALKGGCIHDWIDAFKKWLNS